MAHSTHIVVPELCQYTISYPQPFERCFSTESRERKKLATEELSPHYALSAADKFCRLLLNTNGLWDRLYRDVTEKSVRRWSHWGITRFFDEIAQNQPARICALIPSTRSASPGRR